MADKVNHVFSILVYKKNNENVYKYETQFLLKVYLNAQAVRKNKKLFFFFFKHHLNVKKVV